MGFQTIILTVQFVLSKEKEPISAPCIDSTPAQGSPACRAVNLATVDEGLILETSGLGTISKAGLVSFSKVVQVQFNPCPPCSKSIGIFCPFEAIVMIKVSDKKRIFITLS